MPDLEAMGANLAVWDWVWIILFFVVTLGIGLFAARKAGKSADEFFLSGRSMPWWLLGVSMVATTFSTDTPNLVTDIVRNQGVAGNWVWWAFLLTGMLTVFVYAKLWRRLGVMTDIEFYEIRYSGKEAAFLRGFRAIYLGLFFNIMVMASVNIAAIKIGAVMFGTTPMQTIIIAGTFTVIYSMLGGLRGVILTDFVQFSIAMIGSVLAAYFALSHDAVGGLSGLLSSPSLNAHYALADGSIIAADAISSVPEGAIYHPSTFSYLPEFSDPKFFIPILLVPLAVQWWSTWYPGAEPGGGGYAAQRMLSAKNENHAMGATLFFQIAHYALRPWPWMIVALCSMLVFPTLEDIRAVLPNAPDQYIKDDIAYPAMLKLVLPTGVLGLVLASLIAAYMSTISTQLNWGSSYIVNDWYNRFINRDASQPHLVLIGRISTLAIMVLAGALSLFLSNALEAFQIMLSIGAGTGLLFILRWFWWRINAWSEISAMIISFIIAVTMQFSEKLKIDQLIYSLSGAAEGETLTGFFGLIMNQTEDGAWLLEGWVKLIVGVSITTIGWVLVTYLTKTTDESTLRAFVKKADVGGPGWKAYCDSDHEPKDSVSIGIVCMLTSTLAVYLTIFTTGSFIYGQIVLGLIQLVAAIILIFITIKLWKSSQRNSSTPNEN